MTRIDVRKLQPVHEDDRGIIADLFNGSESVHHIGWITFAKGVVRANHYHHRSAQIDYVVSGKLELRTKDAENPDATVDSVILEAGDIASIPPKVIHAYRAIEPATIVDITTLSREGKGYEDDTVRVDSLF